MEINDATQEDVRDHDSSEEKVVKLEQPVNKRSMSRRSERNTSRD